MWSVSIFHFCTINLEMKTLTEKEKFERDENFDRKREIHTKTLTEKEKFERTSVTSTVVALLRAFLCNTGKPRRDKGAGAQT